MQNTTTWPEGVIARYLTIGGGTVDLTERPDEIVVTCSGGCSGFDFDFDPTCTGERWESWTHDQARTWAQEHAERCRAMPRPA